MAGLGFSLRWKICPKTAMEVVDFAVDFCVGFFGRKMQKKDPPKKSAGKSASRKQNIRQRTTPPKSASQTPKSATKPTNKSACQPPSTRRVFSIEKDFRDAEMTIKIIFERSNQKGGQQRVRKEGQQGTHLGILLSG